ncbi:MAG: thioredoxin domain-containing protein, partial [Chloroflexota bacterium]|nr:thioredoxin domain-containing protein [Chloroflexota bacterium]
SDDHEQLITRPRELQDNATPSGNAMAAFVLLRLAGLSGELRYAELARRSLGQVQTLLAQYPLGFGQWLIALDYALAHPREIAIVGDPDAGDTRALLEVCRTGYRPHQIVALGAPDAAASTIPLLQGRNQIEGCATAYVCVDMSCRAPVTDPQALQVLLE